MILTDREGPDNTIILPENGMQTGKKRHPNAECHYLVSTSQRNPSCRRNEGQKTTDHVA